MLPPALSTRCVLSETPYNSVILNLVRNDLTHQRVEHKNRVPGLCKISLTSPFSHFPIFPLSHFPTFPFSHFPIFPLSLLSHDHAMHDQCQIRHTENRFKTEKGGTR